VRDDETDTGDVPRDPRPSFVQTINVLRDSVKADFEMLERLGPVAVVAGFNRPSVCVAAPELVGEVLLDRKRCFSNRDGWGHFIGELFARGLMLRDFDDHLAHRRIMQVAFREGARRAYHEPITAETTRTLDFWATRKVQLRFFPAIKQALLGQAAVVFLGMELGDRAAQVTKDFLAMANAAVAPLRWKLPFVRYGKGLRARERTVALLRDELPKRRGREGRDMLTILCNAADEDGKRFTDDEVIDHMIFLLFAAHDTTTTALCTLIEQLATNPHWQTRLREECRALGNGPITYDQLDALEQCDWAINEALRINPPVPYLLRRTVKACPVAGYEVKSHVPVSVFVRSSHFDETIWTDPHTFDPERFCPARQEDRKHMYAWIPFGGGAHRCIGADFSRQQAKVFLQQFLTRFEFACPEGRVAKWQHLPLPRPRDGLPLVLKPI
jgi:cytochrome P450